MVNCFVFHILVFEKSCSLFKMNLIFRNILKIREFKLWWKYKNLVPFISIWSSLLVTRWGLFCILLPFQGVNIPLKILFVWKKIMHKFKKKNQHLKKILHNKYHNIYHNYFFFHNNNIICDIFYILIHLYYLLKY